MDKCDKCERIGPPYQDCNCGGVFNVGQRPQAASEAVSAELALLSEEGNKTKYVKREDGEGFEVPLGEIYRIACCDCGLVHDVVFVYEDGKLGMAVKRNNTETGRRRINEKA